MIVSIFFIAAGFMFILFNKSLVELEKKLSRKKIKGSENLFRTQFYVSGGFMMFVGFIVLVITYDFF